MFSQRSLLNYISLEKLRRWNLQQLYFNFSRHTGLALHFMYILLRIILVWPKLSLITENVSNEVIVITLYINVNYVNMV